MRPMNNAMKFMLDFVNDKEKAEAQTKGLGNDTMHLLGYLKISCWREAKRALKGDDLEDLKKLLKIFDLHQNVDFYAQVFSEEFKTARDLMIEKYTQRLSNLKENQAKEEEGRTGGLTDAERQEYEGLIKVTAEVIRDLKALPNI